MSGMVLKLGDGFAKFNPERSTDVKALQKLLIAWGYNISETGEFDWATDGAVLHFQRSIHIGADAKVSVGAGKTWPALLKPAPIPPPGASYIAPVVELAPFIHQFDDIHVERAGNTACFRAAETMLRAVGVKQAGPSAKFQIITKETWKGDVPTHTVDSTALADGIKYLDEQLDKGTPVMVGVSYDDERHNEGITEHFVVVIKKVGDGDYRFHDPATSSKANGANRQFLADATTKNLGAAGIPGQEGYAIGARYYVSMIRKNE